MDRREFLKVLPGIGLIGRPGSDEAKPFEEDLCKILFHSPHLAKIRAGYSPTPIQAWIDGQECSHGSCEIVASPRPDTPARGAVRVYLNRHGQMIKSHDEAYLIGDELATEWRIGKVVWRFA